MYNDKIGEEEKLYSMCSNCLRCECLCNCDSGRIVDWPEDIFEVIKEVEEYKWDKI